MFWQVISIDGLHEGDCVQIKPFKKYGIIKYIFIISSGIELLIKPDDGGVWHLCKASELERIKK
jgi:hypothetical protein